MDRYICIHGHFYQPPRENPWLEEVEQQDSAYPYHDWDERITAECYAPNTASRFLDSKGSIIDIINNYSNISFNFGPTLLSWLERHKPKVYQSILDADKKSLTKFSGHGSALAQVYNHIIMPLASSRDKRTQVIWGIRDFEYRFGRRPEGMWLAETAVDLETLDIMSELGINFTILAPHQAQRIRKIDTSHWQDVHGQKIDPKQPYLCLLPSGRSITLFFYDGPISQEVSFRNLLSNGENFAKRLLGVFSSSHNPQIVNIATDGETYGHHHHYGEMALTYCLHYIESNNLAKITIYGEYLEKFPPSHEVEIHENSSWSCSHGVERWKSDCGCNTGMKIGWKQRWRSPLREAMDWLRDTLIPLYEKEIACYVESPWKTRDEYIEVILSRSIENVDVFFLRHAVRRLAKEEKIKVLKLLELQRNAMLMYTSCGWFFDDISGIETIQIMSYAACAIQTAKELGETDLTADYVNILKQAPSNVSELKNGETVYNKFVKPAVTDLVRVGAHYAMSSLFEQYSETITLFCYTASSEIYKLKEAGTQRLATGKTRVVSHVTWEEKDISFAILHLGDHNIIGGIRSFMGNKPFKSMQQEIDRAFMKSDITRVIRLIEKHFGKNNYSLWHLFKDEQRKILNQVINSTLEESESSFRQTYKQYYPIMQVMEGMIMPLPRAFYTAAEFTLNTDLRNLLEAEQLDLDGLKTLIREIKRWSIEIDKTTLNFVATLKVNALLEKFHHNPEDSLMLGLIHNMLELFQALSLELELWQAQNIYFSIGKKTYPEMLGKANAGSNNARGWIKHFNKLGQHLQVRRPQ
jgi:alpha-amylase/alpha-mannosidase (GH57 family)